MGGPPAPPSLKLRTVAAGASQTLGNLASLMNKADVWMEKHMENLLADEDDGGTASPAGGDGDEDGAAEGTNGAGENSRTSTTSTEAAAAGPSDDDERPMSPGQTVVV